MVVIGFSGDGPVYEEQVDVVHVEFLEAVVDAPCHFFGLVQVVPYFCANEEVLACDGGGGGEEVADGVADFALVLVEPSAVEVAVAGLEGVSYRGIGFAWVVLGCLLLWVCAAREVCSLLCMNARGERWGRVDCVLPLEPSLAKVPKPTAGMETPLLSLYVFSF